MRKLFYLNLDLDNVDTTTDAIHEDFETNEDDAVFEGEIDLDARDVSISSTAIDE